MKMGLTLALAGSVLVGCSSNTSTNTNTSSTSTNDETKVLRVGMECNYAPFNWTTTQESDTTVPITSVDYADGFDVVMASKLAEAMGMELEIVKLDWDSLIPALQHDQIDAVIAGMTVTDERKQAYDFSTPYYTATQVMIVKSDSDIQKASDMKDKKIVVIQGYTGETCVQEMGYNYEAFKKGTEAIMELVNGKCDVVVIDSATAEKFVGDNEGLKIVEDPDAFEAEEYAIAVKKGNTELLNQINASVQKMLDDGTVSELSAKYLDVDTEEDASGSDAE